MLIKQDNKSLIRTILSGSIKNSIQQMGFGHLEKVMQHLDSNYRIYLFDCYDHPEIFKKTLNSLYGEHTTKIIATIENELGELKNQKPYSDFLKILRKS